MKEVWYVLGADEESPIPVLFETKTDAERYARLVFPHENPDARYSRVFYRTVHTMDEFLGVAHKPQ